jgi:hypothetical protein
VPKIYVACYGPNHSFLIFFSRPYLLLLSKLSLLSLSLFLCPSSSTCPGPWKATRPTPGLPRRRWCRRWHPHRLPRQHQHHPHGKAKGSASALMPCHLLPEPELEPPHAACTEPEPELPVSTPGERLLCFFPPPSAPPTVALSPFPLSS